MKADSLESIDVKLRLYHHGDGARVAYREAGSGPTLALLHSELLSHMEFEPVLRPLAERFRVVLPDLPLHGDSEDRPHHPYTRDWFVDVMSGFAREVLGPRPHIAGRGAGAEIALRAVGEGRVAAASLVLMPNRLHGPPTHPIAMRVASVALLPGAVPGVGGLMASATRLMLRPALGMRLTARGNPAACDLVRHARESACARGDRARAWSRCARRWPRGRDTALLGLYGAIEVPVLLLWADEDRSHPLALAEEALERLPNAQLRVLEGSGPLMAYDNAVGLTRELLAFCG